MAYEIQADYASGSILYAIIRSPAGQVWHPAEQAFEDWGTGGHAIDDYDIALTDKSGSRYVGSFDTRHSRRMLLHPDVPTGGSDSR